MWCDVAYDKRVMSATMMNHSRRQIQPPVPSNKRKERGDGLDGVKPSAAVTTKSLAKPSIHHRGPPPAPVKSPHPPSNNHLLAGYLAHEFLNNGTFFGEPWDPVRPEPVPLLATSSRLKASGDKRKAEPSGIAEKQLEKQQRYVEVAHLLKEDGTYLPGIVNPKQLARFLHLG